MTVASAALLHAAEPATTATVPRLALVIQRAPETLAALAEVRLTEAKAVRLVERSEVDRVLAEQKLSRAGLVGADQAVALGRVLHAEMLAVLEANEQGAGSLVVFDATTGARLVDAAFGPGNGEAAADAVAAAVKAAVTLHTNPAANAARTICVLTVRNADLPRSMDGLSGAAGRLMERRLLSSGRVAVLERSRLEHVNRERALPTTRQAWDDLTASLVIAELDIGRGEGDGLRATAHLSTAAGKPIAAPSVAVASSDAAALGEALAEAVLKALRVEAAGADRADLAAEAARFLREAEFAWSHHDDDAALRAAEAARALQPEDLAYRSAVAKAHIAKGRHCGAAKSDGERAGGLSHLRQGAALMYDAGRSIVARQAEPAPIQERSLTDASSLLKGFLYEIHKKHRKRWESLQPDQRAMLDEVYTDYRAYRIDVKYAVEVGAVHDAASFDTFCRSTNVMLRDLHDSMSPTSERWTADTLDIVTRWMPLHRRFAPRSTKWSRYVASHATGLRQYGTSRFARWADRGGLTDSDVKRQYATFELLRDHPDPRMVIYAEIGRAIVDIDRFPLPPDEISLRMGELHRFMRDYVAEAPETIRGDVAEAVREVAWWVDAIVYEQKITYGANIDWVEYYLRGGLVDEYLFKEQWSRFMSWDGEKKYADREARCRRILEVLRAPESRILRGDREQLIDDYEKQLSLAQRRLDSEEPQPPPAKPWREARLLADVYTAHSGVQWLRAPLLHGEAVYAAAIGAVDGYGRDPYVQLLRVDLEGRQKLLGKIASRVKRPYWLRMPGQRPGITEFGGHMKAAVGDGLYALSDPEEGIVIFPLNGGEPRRLPMKKFPSPLPQAIALLNGKVYAALGKSRSNAYSYSTDEKFGEDGYLVSYDLKTGAVETLASGLRKERRSPFDDRGPLRVHYMAADPAQNRILFLADVADEEEASGLWAFEPATESFRRLAPYPAARESGHPAFTTVSGDPAWDPYVIFGGQARPGLGIVAVNEGAALSPPWRGLPADARPTTAPSAAPNGFHDRRFGPFAAVDGWLWHRWARSYIDGSHRQILQSLREGELEFQPTLIAPLPGRSQVIVTDVWGVYLLTLGNDAVDDE